MHEKKKVENEDLEQPFECSVLFARQNIFNNKGKLHAYELLYRDKDEQVSGIDCNNSNASDNATSHVLSHAFIELDFDVVLGKYPAFINFSKSHLLRKIPELLPKDRVVIEILETVDVDHELVQKIVEMKKKGYRFALDDFVYDKRLEALINLVDIIKIDVLNLSEQEVMEQLACLEHYKGKLLAEKVETRDVFTHYKQLGFDYFQGYYFNKPELIRGKKISSSKTILLHLLSDINNPNIPLYEVEESILSVPKLSYRILRLVNSAAMYAGRKIDSLMDAIKQLGLGQIGDWVSLLLFSSIDDGSYGILEKTLVRAKMCECLARQCSSNIDYHKAFTIGVLSTIDILLNDSMENLLSKISLSDDLNDALLEHKGELGKILTQVLIYEQGDFDKLDDTFDQDVYMQAYMLGLSYSRQVMKLLGRL